MEGNRGNLEGKAGKNEHETEQQAERGGSVPRECGRDAVEVHRSGEAVKKRNAVKQDAARKRSENEIFKPRLRRTVVRPPVRCEHIGREALQFEAYVERHETGRGDHHRPAERREEDQHRIFGAMLGIAFEPAVRRDDGDRGGEENDGLAERAEHVGRDQTAEHAAGVGRRTDQREGRDDEKCDGGPTGHTADSTPAERSDHHQDDAANREDQLRQDGCKLVHRCAASAAWCSAFGCGLPGLKSRSPAGADRSIRSTSRATSARNGRMKLSG